MRPWFLLLILAIFAAVFPANGADRKVVLQGFWWDYWNNNYANNWSTYLADLAPRLREIGIDAVWIPPTIKNKNATGSVGYSPFDHYDLGDKFQGGSTGTRFGTKDNYLRAVAVFHANGIDVIQDVVFNHMDGAGSDTGAGGQDPIAPSNKWKNFRYVSFATPGTSQDAANYGARRGRFPKNWQNFHPNPDHNSEGDDITAGFFGPDICYYREARGLSSNSSYNPAQEVDYMRNGMRRWVVWMKNQTGVDGFRFDATKHFETWAMQDFLWNLANNAGSASGGPNMFAVGEYVGSASEMDAWVNNVNTANGGTTDLVGTFDFSLRGALKGMIDGQGNHNLATIPGAQQSRRGRTVPFVNNHDTFRPQLDANGRYIGWNSGNEIGGHIDPNDPRIQAAYAVALAIDGSPQIFFEDLFDLHSTGRRWTHQPTNITQLPVRGWLTNQIWCHNFLNFKEGAYKVRWQAADLLVIERSARAIVAVNDNWTVTQTATVQTDFGANVSLHDYSGAFTNDVVTDATGRVTISAPPCNGTNLRRGYSIWGRAGIDQSPEPIDVRFTEQKWEMADDLGDSHSSSLRQGGALPASSIATRTVGRVFPAAGKTVSIEGVGSRTDGAWQISVLAPNLTEITNVAASGVLNMNLSFVPRTADFHTIRIRNLTTNSPGQNVSVKARYVAPSSRFTPPPIVVQQPTNIFTVAGSTVRFVVEATGDPVYTWTRNGEPLGSDPILTLGNVTVEESGTFIAQLLNEARLVESNPATLTVYPDAVPQVGGVSYSGAGFVLQVTGRVGLAYEVEASTDLRSWTTLETLVAPFTFSEPPIGSHRFFRLKAVGI